MPYSLKEGAIDSLIFPDFLGMLNPVANGGYRFLLHPYEPVPVQCSANIPARVRPAIDHDFLLHGRIR